MPRILNSEISSRISETVTSPRYLVELGFETPIRVCDVQSLTWFGVGDFLAVNLDIILSEKPKVSIFNDQFSFGATILSEGTAGKSLKIWKTYKDSSITGTNIVGHANPVLVFDGEMGEATITENIVVVGKKNPERYTPNVYVQSPTFNFLPKAGTIINIPNQKVVLE
jgi:hypothetical protein